MKNEGTRRALGIAERNLRPIFTYVYNIFTTDSMQTCLHELQYKKLNLVAPIVSLQKAVPSKRLLYKVVFKESQVLSHQFSCRKMQTIKMRQPIRGKFLLEVKTAGLKRFESIEKKACLNQRIQISFLTS